MAPAACGARAPGRRRRRAEACCRTLLRGRKETLGIQCASASVNQGPQPSLGTTQLTNKPTRLYLRWPHSRGPGRAPAASPGGPHRAHRVQHQDLASGLP